MDEATTDQVRMYSALEAVTRSEGGKIILEDLFTDVIGGIDTLTATYSELSHVQIVVLISRIKERLDIIRMLTNAKSNRDILLKHLPESMAQEANRLFAEHEAMVDPNPEDAG